MADIDYVARLRLQADLAKEAELESLLFSSVREPNDLFTADEQSLPGVTSFWEDRGASAALLGPQDSDDEAEERLALQQAPMPAPAPSTAAPRGKKRKPAWVDPDDVQLKVPVAAVPRLRKLRQTEEETVLSGAQYQERLRQQHRKLNPRQAWAALDRPRAALDTALEGLEPTTAALLSCAGGLKAQNAVLPPGQLELSRLKDCNAEGPSEGVVRALRFHPQGRLLLTGGMDKRLRLFEVDGVKNRMVDSIFVTDLPITDAQWAANGAYIVAGGRRRHFYVFDVESQKTERVAGCFGARDHSYDTFAVSSDELRPCAAFLGERGQIHLLSLKSRQAIGVLTQSHSVRCAAFGTDGHTLYTCGGGGLVHVWDIRARRCLARGLDEGCLQGTALAVTADGATLASGSSSGVVNLYRSDDLAWADSESLGVGSSLPLPHMAPRLHPLKSLMHLTMAVDCLRFSPTSEIMAFASSRKRDSLKLLHLRSQTVFANWPTQHTALGHVYSVDFSPKGGLLAVGNAKGRALLYRLHHFNES